MGEWQTVGLNELTDLLKENYSSETFMVGVDSDNMIYYIVPTEMGLDPSLQIVQESVEINDIFGVLGAKGFPRGIYLWIEEQPEEEGGGLLDDADLGDLMSGGGAETPAPAGEVPRPPVEQKKVPQPPSSAAPEPAPEPDPEPEPEVESAPPAPEPKPIPAPEITPPAPEEQKTDSAGTGSPIPDFVPQTGTKAEVAPAQGASAAGDDDDMDYMVKELQKLREKLVPLEQRLIDKEDEIEFMKSEFETLQTFIHNHFIEFGGDPMSLPEDTMEKVELIAEHIHMAQKAVHEDLEQQRKMLIELEKGGGGGSEGASTEIVDDLKKQLEEARSSNKALMEQLMKTKSESRKQIAELERQLKEATGEDGSEEG